MNHQLECVAVESLGLNMQRFREVSTRLIGQSSADWNSGPAPRPFFGNEHNCNHNMRLSFLDFNDYQLITIIMIVDYQHIGTGAALLRGRLGGLSWRSALCGQPGAARRQRLSWLLCAEALQIGKGVDVLPLHV